MIDINNIEIQFNEKIIIENVISENHEYTNYVGKIQGISICIIDNKDSIYEENFNMLQSILYNLDEYRDICANRIKNWFGHDGDFLLKEIQCGCILYDNKVEIGNVFSITVTKKHINYNWNYTIKFTNNNQKEIGWPIGVEIWSEHRIKEENNLINTEDYHEDEYKYINIAMDKKDSEYNLRKAFFDNIVNVDGEYEEFYIKDYYERDKEIILVSKFCGTKVLKNYFYTLGCGKITGNIIEDCYSNYNLKFIIEDTFYPLGVEFFVG